MTVLRRMTRLLKADIHGILDGLEEPEEVLKQTIRDMEAALAHKERILAALQSHLHRLHAEEQALAQAARDIDHHIDLCFEASNHALARNFIRKRLVTQRQARQLSRAIAEAHSRQEAHERTLAEQRQQLAVVVQQLDLYTATRPPETTPTPPFMPGQGPGPGEVGVTDDEVEVAFLDEQRRRAGRTQTAS